MRENDARPQRFAAARGTNDVLPEDWPYWRYIRATAERVCELYGYRRIETPVFEHAGVYLRTSGAGTDIVEKEVYVFEDRGGDRLALRPEGTAGVMRAYVEHGLASAPQPLRLYYIDRNFRYDRPQAGRYRQHTQLGVEAVGDPSPLIDAEVIDLLLTFYRELGISGFSLKINTIGDRTCRPRYIEALRDYYRPHLDTVCADCRVRFEKNPLRLLDCKEEQCQPVIARAPRLHDYLCEPCREHFDQLQRYLSALKIGFAVDERLVRGLDYYTRTVFEVHPEEEGAQSAMGSGGRYDDLIELLGGPPTPGTGFGTGFERLIINLKRQEVPVPPYAPPALYIAHLDETAVPLALELAGTARAAGCVTLVGSQGRSLKAHLRHANARDARYAAIIGATEAANGEVTLRDLRDRTERRLKLHDAIHAITGDGSGQ